MNGVRGRITRCDQKVRGCNLRNAIIATLGSEASEHHFSSVFSINSNLVNTLLQSVKFPLILRKHLVIVMTDFVKSS